MQTASGLLSKISDSNYRLVTMDGELLLNGNTSLSDGFYSNLDLSNFSVQQDKTKKYSASNLFSQSKAYASEVGASECLDLGDDCVNPNDCDCDCAECVAP